MDEYQVDHFFEEVEKANNEAVKSVDWLDETELRQPRTMRGFYAVLNRWAWRG